MKLESHFRGYMTWDAYFITFPFYALCIKESFLGSSRYILLITVNIYWMLTICRVYSESFISINQFPSHSSLWHAHILRETLRRQYGSFKVIC